MLNQVTFHVTTSLTGDIGFDISLIQRLDVRPQVIGRIGARIVSRTTSGRCPVRP